MTSFQKSAKIKSPQAAFISKNKKIKISSSWRCLWNERRLKLVNLASFKNERNQLTEIQTPFRNNRIWETLKSEKGIKSILVQFEVKLLTALVWDGVKLLMTFTIDDMKLRTSLAWEDFKLVLTLVGDDVRLHTTKAWDDSNIPDDSSSRWT